MALLRKYNICESSLNTLQFMILFSIDGIKIISMVNPLFNRENPDDVLVNVSATTFL